MTGWCKGWRAASVYALPVRRRAKRLQRRTEIVHLSNGYSFVAIETHGAAALYAQQFRLFLFIPRLCFFFSFSSFLPKKTQDLVGPTAPDSEARWAETLGRSGAQSLEPSVRWDIHPEVTIARGSEWHDTVCRWEGSFPDLERHPRGNQPWL